MRVLGQREAVDLASAWASHRARSLGIRLLVIKGPLAGRLGLRNERISSDADVLVEPGRRDELADHLREYGWRERPTTNVPRIVESHSRTMIHDGWPIDIDVHSFWPGFLDDPREVFDGLWQQRLDLTLAGVPVAAPGIEAGILILALHSLRKPLARNSDRADRLETLRQRAVAALAAATAVPAATRPVPAQLAAAATDRLAAERLMSAAAEFGAVQTAAPFLRLFGVSIDPDPHPSEQLVLWHLKAETNGNVGAWLLEFRRARGLSRLRVAGRAMLPSPRDLRQLHPELPPGVRGLALGWLRRWRSGLAEAPRTIVSVKRLRPSRRRVAG